MPGVNDHFTRHGPTDGCCMAPAQALGEALAARGVDVDALLAEVAAAEEAEQGDELR
jgi:hypothetical protein